MKLLFKQRIFSWLDSYDIYDEAGRTVFSVEGQLNWGHCLHILDSTGRHVGTVKERVISFLPRFEIYDGDTLVGSIRKEFSFLFPRFTVDCKDWEVHGQIMEWDYEILNGRGQLVATVTKELFNWSDTYMMDIADPADALYVLMVVLAIDAEKCSRD
jgi:uncharacterized protein YxjI